MLDSINGYTYDFIDKKFEDWNTTTWVIAQEIEKVFPRLVSEQSWYKAVNYIGLIPILLESIKELKNEVDILKNKS